MVSVLEFWRVRLDEDEATSGDRRDGGRVLCEVEADRDLLRRFEDHARLAAERREAGRRSVSTENIRDAFFVAVLIRVAVHRDHPDYQEGWAL